jgi:hypothetical protein
LSAATEVRDEIVHQQIKHLRDAADLQRWVDDQLKELHRRLAVMVREADVSSIANGNDRRAAQAALFARGRKLTRTVYARIRDKVRRHTDRTVKKEAGFVAKVLVDKVPPVEHR